jgi:uncharacterized FlgJ-related protein
MYKLLSESNLVDSFISRVVTSNDCRIYLQLCINSVEKELQNGCIINTNMTYKNYRKEYSKLENKTDRNYLAAYFISLIIKYVQVGLLSKNKIFFMRRVYNLFTYKT